MMIRLVEYRVLGAALIQEPGSVNRAGAEGQTFGDLPAPIAGAFRPVPEFEANFGPYKSLLAFDDGRSVRDSAAWREQWREILASWHRIMGAWPALIDRPSVEILATERSENFEQRKVRVEIAPGRTTEGDLLVPEGRGPFPAVLVVSYEPKTAARRCIIGPSGPQEGYRRGSGRPRAGARATSRMARPGRCCCRRSPTRRRWPPTGPGS
jgi:hypothetical protein